MAVKFIHAADCHLDSALSGLERYEGAHTEEIHSATRRAFDNLIELAIDEAVAFVFGLRSKGGLWVMFISAKFVVGSVGETPALTRLNEPLRGRSATLSG